MAKRITDEERVLSYFMFGIENEVIQMAEKVVLEVRTRFGKDNPKMGPMLAPKQPRKRAIKLREPEVKP